MKHESYISSFGEVYGNLICIMNLHCYLHKYSCFRVSKSFYSKLVNNGWLDFLDFDIVVDKRQFTPLFPELVG